MSGDLVEKNTRKLIYFRSIHCTYEIFFLLEMYKGTANLQFSATGLYFYTFRANIQNQTKDY